MTPLATQPSRTFCDREAGVRVERYWIAEHSDLLADARLVLSGDELERASRYHFIADHNSYVVSRMLLRIVLGERLAIAPGQVRLALGVNGKPRLLGSPICFNLSRSHNAVVIAVGERSQVGVDIEHRDATTIDPGVVGWVLSANEHARWQMLDSAARCDAFFRAWTRKEALLKGTGEGLNTPMSSVEVLEIADGRPSAGPITVRRGSASWTIVDLFDDPDYAAALAYLLVRGD